MNEQLNLRMLFPFHWIPHDKWLQSLNFAQRINACLISLNTSGLSHFMVKTWYGHERNKTSLLRGGNPNPNPKCLSVSGLGLGLRLRLVLGLGLGLELELELGLGLSYGEVRGLYSRLRTLIPQMIPQIELDVTWFTNVMWQSQLYPLDLTFLFPLSYERDVTWQSQMDHGISQMNHGFYNVTWQSRMNFQVTSFMNVTLIFHERDTNVSYQRGQRSGFVMQNGSGTPFSLWRPI